MRMGKYISLHHSACFATTTPEIAGVCQPMRHRGCGGNENKFDSAAKCKEQCIEKKGKAKVSSSPGKGANLVG
ncbi:Kunitz/Bovine pancreatic trypsin inhibitor domain protein [Ancylostoma duodenale]|uniref:Kunitz/Bovine pancreatic trypsin inhibitor domain protein n=1 Tax=Ancylostoma duodenale TaxID=51022 RepID=A0A0C2C468_9BILA|nr:Kunitz/Bovine pancreatic trypsin inhibitor domain protein [Ancylostoma duodenale]